MELFSLLAKLTLDTKEFDKELQKVESSADNIKLDEPKLGLDKDDFSGKLTEAERESETFGGSIRGIFDEISGVLVASGIVAAVGSIVASLKEGVELAKNHGDQIDKQSKKMGISAKAYQEWSHALDLSGASITDLNRGMKNWRASLGDDNKMKELGEAFNALGIDAEEAFAKIKSGENLDNLLDNVLYGLADAAPGDVGWIGKALFGNNWDQLNPLLEGSAEDIRAMKDEAEELGLVMSDQEVANAAAYMDATTRLEASLNGIKEAFAGSILPLLTDAANTVAKIIAFFNPRTQGGSWSDQFADTDKDMQKTLVQIEGTSDAAMDLVDKLLAMGNAEQLTAEQQAEWKANADWLIKNIPSLSGVIDKDTLSIAGNKEAITANIQEWKKLSTERAIAEAKEKKYQMLLDQHSEALDKQATATAKANDASAKYYEVISEANKLLSDNKKGELGEMFSALFGVTSIDKNADNLQEMVDWLSEVGYEFSNTDTRPFQDVLDEYLKLNKEAGRLSAEASKFDSELQTMQSEYESWCIAITELYGTEASEAQTATAEAQALKDTIDSIPDYKRIEIDTDKYGYSRAIGDAYIPYDNFPALLHRGEKVLTATAVRRNEGQNVDLSGLEDRLAAAIRNGMKDVTVQSYINGREVTAEVNRESINQVKNRRYRR